MRLKTAIALIFALLLSLALPFPTLAIYKEPGRGELNGTDLAAVTAQAKRHFGPRYAGIWIGRFNQQVRIGVAGIRNGDISAGEKILQRTRTPGTVVGVPLAETTLNHIRRSIQDQLSGANYNAPWIIMVGERADLNLVQMTVPPTSQMTSRQKEFVERVTREYRYSLYLVVAKLRLSSLECRGLFCSPPLRAGINAWSRDNECTAGYTARSRSDRRWYQLTAGHCTSVLNLNWLTRFADFSVHTIGAAHNRVFGSSGDVGIFHVNNPAGWNPHPWVLVHSGKGVSYNPTYSIKNSASAVVGQRMCLSGASGNPSNCGVVSQTNVTVTYLSPRATVNGLFQTTNCARPGDSGAPMFSFHVAYGLVSGATLSSCLTLGQPVPEAEDLMRVDVAYD